MTAYQTEARLRSPKHARHIGFLNYRRHWLGLGAIAACAALTGVQGVPTNAETVQAKLTTAPAQSYTAPEVVAAPVVRDTFTVSHFSVVQWPVPFGTRMASGYGYRSCAGCSSFHEGLDLNPGNGHPVQAIADGVVSQTGNPSGALGVFVVIDHNIDGQIISSTYAHMQYGSMGLSVGDSVSRGQPVGLVGSTGQSTGPHLHFALTVNGEYIDPLPWLNANVNS